MSDLFSDVLTVLGSASLTLGDMAFSDFELPERISYGGQQQLTTHKLPGGARVLDVLGDDPSAISWSGLFFGSGCQARRAQLEAIRTAGELVDLSFSDVSYQVIVADCRFEETFQRITYTVSCEVMPDVSDEDSDDDSAIAGTGTGETATTEASAKDQGQAATTRARSVASSMPTAPSAPSSPSIQPSGGLGGTSSDVRLA